MAPPLIPKMHGFDVATMTFSHVIHKTSKAFSRLCPAASARRKPTALTQF
jgi:hypothetical protein